MIDNNFFKTTRFFTPKEKTSNDVIFSNELLDLILDDTLKEIIINKYDLNNNFKIEIEGIGNVLAYLKELNRFKLIRLKVRENNVYSYFESSSSKETDFRFKVKEGTTESGTIIKDINLIPIYDSTNLFYNRNKLSQYINSLKGSSDKKQLLDDLNMSWQNFYIKYPQKAATRLFRILESSGYYYLKSINSDYYKEYGVKESFVVTILELAKLKRENKKIDYIIGSVLISETQIDLIISQKKNSPLGDIGFIRSSVSVRNKDQGNTSFGVYTTLEFINKKSENGNLFLFPKKDDQSIRTVLSKKHNVDPADFVDTHAQIGNLFYEKEVFISDFHFMKEAINYDQLRQKIEEKIVSPNSAFSEITKLQDLFKRGTSNHVDNLAALLNLCGKADLIDMDHDLKFKLRYIISNVLLYNKNSI